jgi:hypothetical protein
MKERDVSCGKLRKIAEEKTKQNKLLERCV